MRRLKHKFSIWGLRIMFSAIIPIMIYSFYFRFWPWLTGYYVSGDLEALWEFRFVFDGIGLYHFNGKELLCCNNLLRYRIDIDVVKIMLVRP